MQSGSFNKKNILQVKDLTMIIKKKLIVDKISFDVKEGEFLSILGPSGCGKTTLIRMLIGISKPTSGDIFMNNKSIINLHPSERKMGIVFQDRKSVV